MKTCLGQCYVYVVKVILKIHLPSILTLILTLSLFSSGSMWGTRGRSGGPSRRLGWHEAAYSPSEHVSQWRRQCRFMFCCVLKYLVAVCVSDWCRCVCVRYSAPVSMCVFTLRCGLAVYTCNATIRICIDVVVRKKHPLPLAFHIQYLFVKLNHCHHH